MENRVPIDSPPGEDLLDRLIHMAEEESSEPPPEQKSSPQGDLLSGILSNPAIMQNLPQLMGGLGKILGNASGGQSSHIDRHTALLCAIKPYLSRDRQVAAEHMITFCRMWSTLEGMGISPSTLLSKMTAVHTTATQQKGGEGLDV